VPEGQQSEHFIPFRRRALVRRLADRLEQDGRRDRFLALADMLRAIFHYEFHEKLERLKEHYAPFNPDADVARLESLEPARREAALETLLATLDEVLAAANYHRLRQDQIEAALQGASLWGLDLDVDFSIFERLRMYARGDLLQQREMRSWRTGFRRRRFNVDIYQRLVVVFKLRHRPREADRAYTDAVYLKLFKDIPKMDLEMLLPGTRARIRRLDQIKIGAPLIGGVGGFGMKVWTLVGAAAAGLWAWIVALCGLVSYGVKSFLGYKRTRDRYAAVLTEHLYFQNLNSNAGVFTQLIDAAEEEECKEAILAYYFLWTEPDCGRDPESLDARIERFLHEELGRKADFQIDDALRKLEKLEVLRCGPSGLTVVPIDAALVRLDRTWDAYFPHHR